MKNVIAILIGSLIAISLLLGYYAPALIFAAITMIVFSIATSMTLIKNYWK